MRLIQRFLALGSEIWEAMKDHGPGAKACFVRSGMLANAEARNYLRSRSRASGRDLFEPAFLIRAFKVYRGDLDLGDAGEVALEGAAEGE